MKLTLNRQPSRPNATIGDLLVDGEPFCNTLEDIIRELPGIPVRSWKVDGDTAIPAGTYAIEITWSQRFQRDLPLLHGVPGFDGIRIHAGNTEHDTAGCILVGVWSGGESVHNSRATLESLIDLMEIANIAKRDIVIDVVNP